MIRYVQVILKSSISTICNKQAFRLIGNYNNSEVIVQYSS